MFRLEENENDDNDFDEDEDEDAVIKKQLIEKMEKMVKMNKEALNYGAKYKK